MKTKLALLIGLALGVNAYAATDTNTGNDSFVVTYGQNKFVETGCYTSVQFSNESWHVLLLNATCRAHTVLSHISDDRANTFEVQLALTTADGFAYLPDKTHPNCLFMGSATFSDGSVQYDLNCNDPIFYNSFGG